LSALLALLPTSAFEGKADMPIALQMSAYDPKGTRTHFSWESPAST